MNQEEYKIFLESTNLLKGTCIVSIVRATCNTVYIQGVVTLVAPVEPFATGIKIFDWQNFALIA